MPFKKTFIDQLGREVCLSSVPSKIVSVVPSQTELLFDLGLGNRVIGVTKFCIHPEAQVKAVVKIGGTKQLNLDLIRSLQPDLIIANKEENDRLQIEELMHQFPVWISDINNLQEACSMINSIGEITGAAGKANEITFKINVGFDKLVPAFTSLKVLYLIWRKPYMVAGHHTFISYLLERCGFVNAITESRYPVLNVEDYNDLNADVILLSSEPYPFKQNHLSEISSTFPNAKAYLVDGEMFSWYGSRLLQAPEYFIGLINRIKEDFADKI